MRSRLTNSIVTAAATLGFLILAATPAPTQRGGAAPQRGGAPQRGATPRKPAPNVGAWWYRGIAQPAAQHPDLTGVWFGGGSGDLSQNTLPGQEMVLTPYGKQRYDTVDHSKDPNTQCLPPGPARMIMMAHPAMIVQRDDLVDTVSINDRTWLDTSGHEHSNKLKMTERFRLADTNTLEHIVTYDDPVFFTKPFTTRRTFQRQIGDRIMDHSCLENEKDLINLVPTLGDAGRDR